MGVSSSTLSWEQKLLQSTTPNWGYEVPDSKKPGFSSILRNPAIAETGPEIGCENTSNGTYFYTLWEAMLRGREIAGPDANFLGTRLWKVETREDPHSDKSRLPKNYKPSGYVERSDGSVQRFEYVWDTYQEVHDTALSIGRGLIALGCKEFDNIGVFSNNRAEWITSALGFYSQRLRTVALYATLGPDSIEYIIQHAEIPVVIVSPENLAILRKTLPAIKAVTKKIVVIDAIRGGKYGNTLDTVSAEDKAACAEHGIELLGLSEVIALGDSDEHKHIPANLAQRDDIAFVMYTSGTTGQPRGVILSHCNVLSTLGCIKHVVSAFPHVYFSYLPLAHILETIVQGYVWINGGSVGFSCGDIRRLVDDLQTLRPTLLPGVPRVFLKFYQNVWAQVEKRSCLARWFINRAYNAQVLRLHNNQELDEYYDSNVFSVMREKIGLDRLAIALSGGAPCPSYVAVFMKVLLGPRAFFTEGYGMTECSAGAAVSDPKDKGCGSVGCPLACNDMKLMDLPEMGYVSTNTPPTGEVLLSGPNVFQGYYKDPEATAATVIVDEDGRRWLRTGDVGRINPNGSFSIIDRAKQLIKLAQGEYVPIEKVEDVYGQSPLVSQIWCYGNAYKPFLVAIVVPNAQPLYEFLLSKGWWDKAVHAPVVGALSEATIAEFKRAVDAHYEEVKAWVGASLKQHESGLQGFEKIKAFKVEYDFDSLGQGFNEARNTLTPTMKKRRKPLVEYYLDTLKALYVSLGERETEGEKW